MHYTYTRNILRKETAKQKRALVRVRIFLKSLHAFGMKAAQVIAERAKIFCIQACIWL